MTNKTNRTSRKAVPEKRTQEMEQLHAGLMEQVEQLRTSVGWKRYVTAAADFHNYSLNNLLLILSQCPIATQVAGFHAWQKKGRQVRKGEKSIRIFGGRSVVQKDEDGQPMHDDQGREIRKVIFFPTSVFDISQTDVIEGQGWAEPVKRLDGADEAGIFELTAAALRARGYDIAREQMHGKDGYTTHISQGKHVGISVTLSPADAAATLIHEAAHIFLEHVTGEAGEYAAHRGRCEVEAESTAYIVAGMLGLNTSACSVGYVAGWAESATPEELQDSAARILQAARKLADAIAPQEPTED